MWMDFTFDSKKPLLSQSAPVAFSFDRVLFLSSAQEFPGGLFHRLWRWLRFGDMWVSNGQPLVTE